MRCHTGDKHYKCTHCDKSFVNVSHLKYHLKSHGEQHHYKCGKCPRIFEYTRDLRSHMKEHAESVVAIGEEVDDNNC